MSTGIPFPDLSPIALTIPLGSFELVLRWYALSYIVGLLLGWRLAVAILNRPGLWRDNTPPLGREQLEDLLTWIILGVLIGGRLGYVLFYQPAYYLSHPVEVLYLWQGGMAFHGGFLGVVGAVWIYCRQKGLLLSGVADLIAICAPIGLLLGRLANFVNAELWGRATDLPWGVIFPGGAAQACGQPLGELCARHPSQLYEATLEGLVLLILMLWLVLRRQGLAGPWRMTGVFLAGYGFGRFVVEFVRQPDAQFVSPGNPLGLALHMQGVGLTMGQLLSLPMLVLGVWLIRRSRRA